MKKNKISLRLRNDLAELDGLNRRLKAFAKKLGLSSKDIFEINLCVEEQFANIVSHGYIDNQEHSIEMALSFEDGEFTVCIEDDGVAFNPIHVAAPDLECRLEEKEVGGLGVYLTRHFMDHIIYQRCGAKNILLMKKKVSPTTICPCQRG